MSERFLIPTVAKDIIEETLFFNDPRCPFKGTFYGGDARVLAIVGENASGKSLLYRMIASSLSAEHKITPITLSIRERTGGGTYEMTRMRQMMMFGDETQVSTGANSARVVKAGFHNVNSYDSAALLLDEPELGLSDGFARALGQYIGEQAAALADNARGVLVVSHNRGLLSGLRAGLGAWPAFIHMGEAPKDAMEWVASPDQRSVEDLFALGEIAGERRKLTQQIFDKKKGDAA